MARWRLVLDDEFLDILRRESEKMVLENIVFIH